jgi:hypothetical protein
VLRSTLIPVLFLLAPAAGATQSSQASGQAPGATLDLLMRDLTRLPLAGRSLAGYPHFVYTRAFNAGAPVELAIDPFLHPQVVGRTADAYVIVHKEVQDWRRDRSLADAGDGPDEVAFSGSDLASNRWRVDAGLLEGDTGTTELGIAYDVVLDFDRDARLSEGDWVDGLDGEPGLWVMPDLTQFGPHAWVETLYSGGQWLDQDAYYPSDVANLGALPLVVVSHGNGHNYKWYDHIGEFLASWGYVVVSHSNNTGPGIETASQTTLDNTDYFLGNLATIEGGILLGHVDVQRIVWIGHSRGGEGVTRAYDKIVDGTYAPVNFAREDIVLVSSMAPTDFLGTESATPHDAPYHLWTGAADRDVNGCANCDICQTFHLHERARGPRASINLNGVGHGDFHDGGGSSVASGPCLIGRTDTHQIMRGELLALVKWFVEGHRGAKDYLWRSWDDLKPIGAPVGSCVVVNRMFQEAPGAAKLVIDDFQSNPDPALSSSGGAVYATVANLSEGRLDDVNGNFNDDATDPMNGMTEAGPGDDSSGLVFEFDGQDEMILFELPRDSQDLSRFDSLSFRAAQATRHVLTQQELGDLVFSVALIDRAGRGATIRADALGHGLAEPYQRTGCGNVGAGYHNDFETVRLPLRAFLVDRSGVDLTDVLCIAFLFGPSYGSPVGRVGLDEIELVDD